MRAYSRGCLQWVARAYSRGILAVGGEGLFNGILVVGDSVYNYEGLCIPPV